MIEETVKIYLENHEVGAPVWMEKPKNPPSDYFIVEKTGGALTDHIYHSTIAIQSYSASKYGAAKASEKVADLMVYGLIGEPDITKVELSGPYDYTDVQSKGYRYQAVFDITHY